MFENLYLHSAKFKALLEELTEEEKGEYVSFLISAKANLSYSVSNYLEAVRPENVQRLLNLVDEVLRSNNHQRHKAKNLQKACKEQIKQINDLVQKIRELEANRAEWNEIRRAIACLT